MSIKTMWNIPRMSEEANKMLDIRANNAIANEMMDTYLCHPYCLNPRMNIDGLFENFINKYGYKEWFSEEKIPAIIMMCEIMRREIISRGQNIPQEFYDIEKCNYGMILESSEFEKRLDEIMPTVTEINDSFWDDDEYFNNISFDSYNDLTFKDLIFTPAMMLYSDIPMEDGYKYHMNLCYVKDKFTVPCIMQGKKIIDWILPIEVNEARRAVKKATGHVVTCGGGLSYFPFLASQKENVTKITIIEMNDDFSSLIKEKLIPQFDSKCDIEVIKGMPADVISSGMVDCANFIYVSRLTSISWYTDILKVQHKYKGNAEFFYSDKSSCLEHIKNNIWSIINMDNNNIPVSIPETLMVQNLLDDIILVNPDSLKKLFMSEWLWNIIK